jgi:hypothetical protein
MPDTNTGNAINRGAPGYHLESLPDGQQVLVNDRTGMVAVTNPYTGEITGEVPKSQVPGLGTGPKQAGGPVTPKAGGGTPGVAAQPQQNGPSGTTYPPGVTNPQPSSVYKPGVYVPGGSPAQAAQPAAPVSGGVTYPPGVTNPRGTPTPPGAPQRPAGGPDASGGTDPNAGITTAPASAAAQTAGRPPVGTSGYDLWAMNDMLRDNRMNGWQVTGVVPIQQVKTVKNPDTLDLENPYIEQKQNEYLINAMDPSTGNVRTLSFARVWQGPNGTYTDKDPGDGSGYGYQLGDVKDQIKADPNSKGHTGQMTIGDTLWGTNAATGQFEMVPGAPKIPKAWSDVKQIKDKDGSTAWWGVDPADQQLKKVPGMPEIPKEAAAWDNMQLIDDGTGTGNKVWYGTDPTDKVMKPMPNMPKVVAGPKGPASATSNGTIYVQKADGSYEPAKGIPDPNPPAGTKQLILGPDGFIYQQTSRGNGQGFDPDPTFTPVPLTDAAKQSQANAAAHHKAGELGTKVINDHVYHVIYRGDSSDSYEVDTTQPVTRMPGTGTTTSIATGSDQPYIVQRGPDDSISQVNNPNYQPTDPAYRVAQLSQQANAKLAEIQAKIGTTYTGPDAQAKAQAEFDQWWGSNVEPAKQQIQFAQQKQQQDLARSNLATAQNAGSAAVQAASNLHYVGPGFGDLWGKISQGYGTQMPDNITADDINRGLVSEAPNFGDIYEKATAQALQHISPTAAAIVNGQGGGAPTALQQPPDITGQLNRSNYQFGAGLPPVPASAVQTMPFNPATSTAVMTNMSRNPALAGAGQQSTAGLNAMGLLDNPAGRALAAGQSSVPGAPPIYPGQFNPIWQQGTPSAVGLPSVGPNALSGYLPRPYLPPL